MQATQIHLMRHHHTELSNGKYKKWKPQAKSRPMQNKNAKQKQSSYHKKSFDPRNAQKQKDRCSKCGDSIHLEGFTCPAKNTSARAVTNLATSQACALLKVNKNKVTTSLTNQRHISWLQAQFKHMTASQNQKAQTTPSVSSYRSNMYKHRARLTRNQHAWYQIYHRGWRCMKTETFTWEQDWKLALMLISCQHQYINWYSMTQTWRSLHQTSFRLALTLKTQ